MQKIDGITYMNFEEWEEKYQPIRNRFRGANGSFNGTMFETYGSEVKRVKKAHQQNPATVWTCLDSEGSSVQVVSGAHFVNRLGYFITKKPVAKGESVIVTEEGETDEVDFMPLALEAGLNAVSER